MDTMDAKQTVRSIVESMLPRWSGKEIGLKMTLQIQASNYSKDHNMTKSLYVTYLFKRYANYTQGFSKVHEFDDRIRYGTYIVAETANHDSCWNTFDEITQTYFKVCREVSPETAPINVNSRITFDLFNGQPHYIKFDCINKVDITDIYHRDHEVTISKLKFHESCAMLAEIHNKER